MLYDKEMCMEALEGVIDIVDSTDVVLASHYINLLYEVIEDYYKDDKSEKVNHPAHYNTGAFEVIDEMKLLFSKEEVKAFCKLNAYKYFRRAQFKGNPEQDNAKAEWYLKYLEEMEKD